MFWDCIRGYVVVITQDDIDAMGDDELLPCPFCGGGQYRLEAGGQTWRGVKGYSHPQFYHLYHNGVIEGGDGFQNCSVVIRARTDLECLTIWNTRATVQRNTDKL